MRLMETTAQLQQRLKSVDAQIKRQASCIVHLQQELARARSALDEVAATPPIVRDGADTATNQTYDVTDDLRRAQRSMSLLDEFDPERHCACSQLGLRGQHCKHHHHQQGTMTVMVPIQAWQEIKRTMQQQVETIKLLEAEQSKLCGELQHRPTRRELAKCHLEIEGLRSQVRRWKAKCHQQTKAVSDNAHGSAKDANNTIHDNETKDEDEVPVLEPLPTESLTDQINLDLLLRHLRVGTKIVMPANIRSTKHKRLAGKHGWLQADEHVFHYLTVAPDIHRAFPEHRAAEVESIVKARVGALCAEVVAVCCGKLGLRHVRDFPKAFAVIQQSAALVDEFQRFVDKLRAAIDPVHDLVTRPPPVSFTASMEQILCAMEDLVMELHVRRDLMNPPEVKPYDVVAKCMRILRLTDMRLVPKRLEDLLVSLRMHHRFLSDVRASLNVSEATTRSDLLRMIEVLRAGTPVIRTRSHVAASKDSTKKKAGASHTHRAKPISPERRKDGSGRVSRRDVESDPVRHVRQPGCTMSNEVSAVESSSLCEPPST